jgi:hypothetical protein
METDWRRPTKGVAPKVGAGAALPVHIMTSHRRESVPHGTMPDCRLRCGHVRGRRRPSQRETATRAFRVSVMVGWRRPPVAVPAIQKARLNSRVGFVTPCNKECAGYGRSFSKVLPCRAIWSLHPPQWAGPPDRMPGGVAQAGRAARRSSNARSRAPARPPRQPPAMPASRFLLGSTRAHRVAVGK